MAATRICSVEGCGKLHYGRGWCKAHYERYRTRGTVDPCRTPCGDLPSYLKDVVLGFTGDDCLPWPYGTRAYGLIKIDGRNIEVHRLVCEILYGPSPSPKHEAAHRCGNSRCCNPKHLRWATPSENQHDKIAHGTLPQGERHHKTKLTETEVRRIRRLRGIMSTRETSMRFAVSESCVKTIQARKSWKYLP